MKMTLLVLGITALIVGLLSSSILWSDYSEDIRYCQSLETQRLELVRQKEVNEYKSKSLRENSARCEESRLQHRNYLIIFSSLAGVGLVLAISAFLFGRKKEPEETGYSKIDF